MRPEHGMDLPYMLALGLRGYILLWGSRQSFRDAQT